MRHQCDGTAVRVNRHRIKKLGALACVTAGLLLVPATANADQIDQSCETAHQLSEAADHAHAGTVLDEFVGHVSEGSIETRFFEGAIFAAAIASSPEACSQVEHGLQFSRGY
jgi:hypothetical protein